MSVKATSETTGSLNVGDQWEVAVEVRDNKTLTEATVTIDVIDPDDLSTPMTVTSDSKGVYKTIYTLTEPGRFVAEVKADGFGAENFTVTAKAATAKLPSKSDAIAYMGQSGLAFDEMQVEKALDAEREAQAAVCKIGAVYSADLREALLRRVHRNLTMRGVPLGVQSNELGSTYVGTNDPEIKRLEGPYKKRVVG